MSFDMIDFETLRMGSRLSYQFCNKVGADGRDVIVISSVNCSSQYIM